MFGDLHAADKPPGGRVDDYTQAILDKLGAIAGLCEKYEVSYALGTGDVLHVKQPNRVSHTLVQKLITAFKAFPCEVLVTVGNHDIGPDGLDSLPRQPLGTLEKAGAVQILHDRQLLAVDGDPTSQVWIIPHHYNAAAEGVYNGETDPSYYVVPEGTYNGRPIIGLAHGSLLAPGDTRPYPYVNVDDIPNFELYDLLISGHIHESLGVVKVGDSLFANPGSIGRTRRDIPSYTRTVEVLVVTVDENGVSVEEVPVPGVRPATEVFGGREAPEEAEAPSDEITKLVDMLGEGLRADSLSIPELLAEFDIEPETKAVVARLLEEVS